MPRKFRLRFTLVYEVVLAEGQIYPDYPWQFYPEHSRRNWRRKRPKLTAAKVAESVKAAGGAAAIFRDWNLDTSTGGFDVKKAKVARVAVKRHRYSRPRRGRQSGRSGQAGES